MVSAELFGPAGISPAVPTRVIWYARCTRIAGMSKTNPIQVQKLLKGLDYPASKDQIVGHAEQSGGDRNALDTLRKLPDQQYQTPAEVSEAMGKIE